MIEIFIVTHGHFGPELLNSAELIAGKQKNIETLSLNREDDILEFGKKVQSKISSYLDGNNQLLVLTDLFGGSPSNIAAANLKKYSFKCLTGVNLPMLLEAIVLRDNIDNVTELSKKIIKAGLSGIKDIDYELSKNHKE